MVVESVEEAEWGNTDAYTQNPNILDKSFVLLLLFVCEKYKYSDLV